MKKFCITLFVYCLIALPLSAQIRGGGHDEEGPRETAGSVGRSGKQWAVFIAIDNYREKGPLQYPVKDAKEIKNILLEHYYIDEDCVRELYNRDATASAIRRLFRDLQNETGADDSVFIFHAGHGFNDERTKISAWIPYDGGEDIYARVNWFYHWEIRRILDSLEAKHVFLISDSCYSGDLLDVTRGTPQTVINYPAAYDKRSRQAMSSGVSEEVPDKSEFAARLKDALLRSQTPYLTPDSLLTRIKEADTSILLHPIPQFGNIPGARFENGGSFLFFRKNPGQNAAVQPSGSQGASPRANTSSSAASQNANLAFAGDSLAEQTRRTILSGIRTAMRNNNNPLTLDDNASSSAGYNFTVTVYLTTSQNYNLLQAEVIVSFLINSRFICETSPYYITETNENMIARRIAERLQADKAFFEKINEAIK